MPAGIVLRVLSYNIHKGLTLGNRAFVLPEMRAVIAELQPDIVFLQEVLGQHDKHASRFDGWPMLPQFEFLAEGVWPHFAYGKNAVYTHGHHGNAILSKYPIIAWSNTDISTNGFESRGILHAVVDIPGAVAPVHCMCVHLNMLRRGRVVQLRDLCRTISAGVPAADPLIVAGDFNDWSQRASDFLAEGVGLSEVFATLTGAHAQTFPSRFPLLRLDRVYSRSLEPLEGRVLCRHPWGTLSDHAALFAELRVEGAGDGSSSLPNR